MINIGSCSWIFGRYRARKGALMPPIRAANENVPTAVFLMMVGYISAVYMYTTEKFPAANSFPMRARVVLITPFSRNPAIIQLTPV